MCYSVLLSNDVKTGFNIEFTILRRRLIYTSRFLGSISLSKEKSWSKNPADCCHSFLFSPQNPAFSFPGLKILRPDAKVKSFSEIWCETREELCINTLSRMTRTWINLSTITMTVWHGLWLKWIPPNHQSFCGKKVG